MCFEVGKYLQSDLYILSLVFRYNKLACFDKHFHFNLIFLSNESDDVHALRVVYTALAKSQKPPAAVDLFARTIGATTFRKMTRSIGDLFTTLIIATLLECR